MRKYILNVGVLSAVFSLFGLTRTTISGPRDWRLVLLWISALAGIGLAVGTVIEKNKEAEDW
jgi:hypothetical protein